MSMKNQVFALALGLATSFSVALAQEVKPSVAAEDTGVAGAIQIGIGVSYRNFHKANFRSKAGGAYSGWYDNSIGISSLQAGAPDLEAKLPSGTFDTYEYNVVKATWSGNTGNGDYGFGECLAPIVSASYAFYYDNQITLSAVANFQFNMIDSGQKGGLVSNESDTGMLAARVGTEPVTDPAITSGPSVSQWLNASSKYSFDMDLYTLDLGIRLDYAINNQFELFVATGPSVSYADMDSSFRGALFSGNQLLERFGESANSQDWVFGYYASAGAAFWFTEQVGASFEARYDAGFEDAETKLVTQSLDTWGAAMKLLYRF